MIITISGKAGSGKSTIAKLLTQKLGLRHYSIGDLNRKLAQEKGMGVTEFQKYVESHPEIDHELDEMQIKLGKTEDNFVIDGRISFHFIPNSIKIYFDVDDTIGAERILKAKRVEETGESVEALIKKNKERRTSEIKRYETLYNINPYNPEHYDIVIDTSNLNIDQVLEKTLESIKNRA